MNKKIQLGRMGAYQHPYAGDVLKGTTHRMGKFASQQRPYADSTIQTREYADYFKQTYGETVTECAKRLDVNCRQLQRYEQLHNTLPLPRSQQYYKTANSTFTEVYHCSMSARAKKLGISKEAVRKQWLRDPRNPNAIKRQIDTNWDCYKGWYEYPSRT